MYSDNVNQSNIKNEDLSKYKDLIHYYNIKLKKNRAYKKKIKYSNLEEYDQYYTIISSDPCLIVRKENIKIPYHDVGYIRLSFVTPHMNAKLKPYIKIVNNKKGDVEEILSFNIDVI
jgi:hypothetical protein